jgi:hypothetical protein
MTDEIMGLMIPSDAYALELAEQFNIKYGLRWIPEYVQYLATKADPLLDDTLIDHLTLFADHEQITTSHV